MSPLKDLQTYHNRGENSMNMQMGGHVGTRKSSAMIPQNTPLYLVTTGNIDGDPIVTNELVVGWELVENGYRPVTVAIGGNTASALATPALSPQEWEEGPFHYAGRQYRTSPATVQDTCGHPTVTEDSDLDGCPVCGLHIDLAQAHSRLTSK